MGGSKGTFYRVCFGPRLQHAGLGGSTSGLHGSGFGDIENESHIVFWRV